MLTSKVEIVPRKVEEGRVVSCKSKKAKTTKGREENNNKQTDNKQQL